MHVYAKNELWNLFAGWNHHRSINQGKCHREVNSCLPPFDVLCLDVLGPIVSPDQSFIQEMMNLPAPFANGEHPALPLSFRHVHDIVYNIIKMYNIVGFVLRYCRFLDCCCQS